jgi:hypothetical protein
MQKLLLNGYKRTGFGNHTFAMLGNDVYDACALTVGTTLNDYLTTAIDTSTIAEALVAGTSADILPKMITILT